MWERHASDDVIEFSMTVTSVEVPDLGWNEPDERETTAVTAGPVDQTSMPRQGTGTWPNGERAVRLGHAEEILITLATSKCLRLSVSWRSVSSAIRSTAAVGADGSVDSLDEQ